VTGSRVLFDRVWKKFHRGEIHDSLRDLIPAMARSLIGRSASGRELQAGDFWAVRDLSFEVLPGQTLGIIGPNGSGKSTTLKMLTRIMDPTRGFCEVRGRSGTLLEVAAGFHGDLTGRENVFLQGAIMGMKSVDIRRKFDEIVAFSGVADAIDTPVKRYSSGMSARLGFSIAAHLEPEVLIIDEVLAVGDMSFQERAFGRIRELARSGIPVVMVSHQLDRIAELCTDAILLNHGAVAARGTAVEAIAAYVQQHDAGRSVASTGVIALNSVRLIGDGTVRSGERCSIRIDGRVLAPFGDGIEPVLVRVRSLVTGHQLFATGSRWLGCSVALDGDFSLRVDLQANVPAGSYLIEVVAKDMIAMKDIASAPSVMLHVTDAGTFAGTVQLNASMIAV
jgi:ABC-type polysaccharide/polyol phosphate transport system ATPase subunit